MKVYFNYKYGKSTETVDELDSKDFESLKEFRKEKHRLLGEYNLAMGGVHASQRPTKCWSQR